MRSPLSTVSRAVRVHLFLLGYHVLYIDIFPQVLGIICMACAAPAKTIDRSGDYFGLGHNHFFLFVVVTTFIVTLIWTFFYLLQVKDTIKVSCCG